MRKVHHGDVPGGLNRAPVWALGTVDGQQSQALSGGCQGETIETVICRPTLKPDFSDSSQSTVGNQQRVAGDFDVGTLACARVMALLRLGRSNR